MFCHVHKANKKQGNTLCSKTSNKEEALKCAHEYSTSLNYKITDIALQIRSSIQKLRSSCIDLPNPLTAESLIKGHAGHQMTYFNFYMCFILALKKEIHMTM